MVKRNPRPIGSTTLNRDRGSLKQKHTNLRFFAPLSLILTAKYGGAKNFAPISGITQKGYFCSTVKCGRTFLRNSADFVKNGR